MSAIPGSIVRRSLFWLHLSAGSICGLVILLMAVTGVLLTYEHQLIEAAAQRNHRDAAPATQRLSADQLAVIAKRESAPGTRLTLTFDADPTAPVAVTTGRGATLLLNGYTGEKLPDAAAGRRSFFRVVENWHRWIGGEPRGARATLIDIANLVFLFIISSGIYLWLPAVWRWRTLRGLMLFRRQYANSKARDFNWHHVFSLWMLIPLLLIALSGVVMSYGWANNLVYAAFGEEPPRRNGPPGAPTGAADTAPTRSAQEPLANLQQLLDAAASRINNWQRISVPVELTDERIDLSVELQSHERRAPRRSITLSTHDASVLQLASAPPNMTPSPGQRARTWFRFVHTGEQYGFTGQTIAGLASLAACILVYTGLALAWRRLIRPLYRRTS